MSIVVQAAAPVASPIPPLAMRQRIPAHTGPGRAGVAGRGEIAQTRQGEAAGATVGTTTDIAVAQISLFGKGFAARGPPIPKALQGGAGRQASALAVEVGEDGADAAVAAVVG